MVFSSHILDDVEDVCDEIAILNKGQIVYEGTLDGLVQGTGHGYSYEVRVRGDTAAVLDALRECQWITTVEAVGDMIVVSATDPTILERELVRCLAYVGTPIISLGTVERSLEEVVLEVTR